MVSSSARGRVSSGGRKRGSHKRSGGNKRKRKRYCYTTDAGVAVAGAAATEAFIVIFTYIFYIPMKDESERCD